MMGPEGGAERSASKAGPLVLFLIVVAAAAGAWWFVKEWRTVGPGAHRGHKSAGAAMAALVPQETQMFLAADLRGVVKIESVQAELEKVRRSSPEATRAFEQVEKATGVTVASLGKWVEPAVCLAVYPPEGLKSLLPTAFPKAGRPEMPARVVVMLAVRDEEAARKDVATMFRETGRKVHEVQEDGVTFHLDGEDGAAGGWTVADGWFLLGSSKAALVQELKALRRKAPALAEDPMFVEARGRVLGGEMLAYVRVGSVLEPLLDMPGAAGVTDASTRAAVQAMAYKVVSLDVSSKDTPLDGFFKLDPGSQSDLVRTTLSPPKLSRASLALVPSRWGQGGVVNLQWMGRVAYQVACLFPNARAQVNALPTLVSMQIGFNPLDRFQEACTGEAVISGDGLEKAGDTLKVLLPFLPQGGRNAAKAPPKLPEQTSFVVLPVKDPQAAMGLIERIEKAASLTGRVTGKVGEVEIHGYDRPRVRWAMVEKPERAVLIAFGAEPEKRLAEALEAPARPAETAQAQKMLSDLIGETRGEIVSASYADFTRLLQDVAALVPSLPVESVPATVRETLGGFAGYVKGRTFMSATVMSVEKDGVRFRGRGFNAPILVAGGGIVGAILIPNFIRARAQGQLTACKSNLKNIGTALEMYATDNAGRFPPRLEALTPNYLKRIPTCPSTARDTYTQGYEAASGPDAYTVVCSGHNHPGVRQPANYPQYTSTQGLISP